MLLIFLTTIINLCSIPNLILFWKIVSRPSLWNIFNLSLGAQFLMVGLIEVVSIAFRPISLSFRLFGNVFGGENLLTSMTGMAPYGILVPIPFYLYEVLVGVVQALIFTLLVAIYIGLMTNHDEEAH